MSAANDPLASSWDRWLHRRCIYPAIVYLRGEVSVFRRLRRLRDLERLDTELLASRSRQKLADTLNYARDRCTYYGDRWHLSAPVDGSEAAEALRSLPYLTKKELQRHRESLEASPRPRRVTSKTTGGSTGEPVTVLKDRQATAQEMAASWLGYGWFGVRPGDRAARFWGSPRTMSRRLRFMAADFAMHRIRFSAFDFGEEDLLAYWHRMRRFGPDYLYGYVSMIEAFATFAQQEGIPASELGVKSVVATAEVLSPPQRDLLERTFGAPVQNEYGCGEVGPIAYECEEGSLHLMSENLWVEVVDDEGEPAGPGESGEIVVTDLTNRAMPLVRYRVGDFGVRGTDCSCGRGFPVLSKIWGRAYDFVQGTDGRRFHGEYFMYLFEDLRSEGIEFDQFQVIQDAADHVEIRIAREAPVEGELETRIRERLDGELRGVDVDVRRVDGIERADSGKMRVIKNEVMDREPLSPSG